MRCTMAEACGSLGDHAALLQQFFVENVEVPQTQFFDRMVVQLLHRDRDATVQTVQKTVEFLQVQLLDKV